MQEIFELTTKRKTALQQLLHHRWCILHWRPCFYPFNSAACSSTFAITSSVEWMDPWQLVIPAKRKQSSGSCAGNDLHGFIWREITCRYRLKTDDIDFIDDDINVCKNNHRMIISPRDSRYPTITKEWLTKCRVTMPYQESYKNFKVSI